jgi:hypothetical protein
MTLDFSVPGQCSVTMIDYVKECIRPLIRMRRMIKEDQDERGTQHLFVVNPDSKKLSKTRSEVPQCGSENSICYKEQDQILAPRSRTLQESARVRHGRLNKLEHLIDYLRGPRIYH